MEPLDDVERRMAESGDSAELPECLQEFVAADLMGLTITQLRELDCDTIYSGLGYAQGKAVARWAHNEKAGTHG